jgi:hypothetical protein
VELQVIKGNEVRVAPTGGAMDTEEGRRSMFVDRRRKEILERGRQARAVLVGVEAMGARSGVRRVRLTLEVEPGGDPAFRVTKKVLVLRPQLPLVGERFRVRFDPGDPSRVEFDES